jgi:hypothetical protein
MSRLPCENLLELCLLHEYCCQAVGGRGATVDPGSVRDGDGDDIGGRCQVRSSRGKLYTHTELSVISQTSKAVSKSYYAINNLAFSPDFFLNKK